VSRFAFDDGDGRFLDTKTVAYEINKFAIGFAFFRRRGDFYMENVARNPGNLVPRRAGADFYLKQPARAVVGGAFINYILINNSAFNLRSGSASTLSRRVEAPSPARTRMSSPALRY
jgi:hypothetical protein